MTPHKKSELIGSIKREMTAGGRGLLISTDTKPATDPPKNFYFYGQISKIKHAQQHPSSTPINAPH